MKYLFIMSTKAANGKNLPDIYLLENTLKGEDYKFHYTNYHGEPQDIAREYAEKYGEDIAIYACGGDGTINEVATGVLGTDAYMGVIPAGTGNDFCKTIYSGKTASDIILNIKNAQETKLDIIKINENYSLNISSFGFDSLVTEKVVKNEGNIKRYGEAAYLIAAYQSLMEQRQFKLEFELSLANGSTAYGYGDYMFGCIANGKYYGGGFKSAPNALLNDGEADFMIVDPLTVNQIVKLMLKYRKGEHMNLESLTAYQAKSGKIKSHSGPIPANYDGEVFRFEELYFEVLEKQIKFLK